MISVNFLAESTPQGSSEPPIFEWDVKRKCWRDKNALNGTTWRGDDLAAVLDQFSVRVRPNAAWSPVTMHWLESSEDGNEIFQGVDDFGAWAHRVSCKDMIKMLNDGKPKRGTAEKL